MLADFRESHGQLVGQRDRGRHEFRILIAGIPEHHSLVAGTLGVDDVFAAAAGADFFTEVDALGNVTALLVDRHDHAAGVAVEAVQRVVVADAVDDLAGQLRDVDICVGGDLAGNHAQTGGEQRLAGHAAVRVLGEDRVEDRVADLVGHLVGVSFGHAFRGERVVAH
jgi:hypothetical protein